MIYAALFSEDNTWYRCSVIQNTLPNKLGMCSVHYIDYGNYEEISYRYIVEIPEPLQKIPPIACKFIFTNLICDNKSSKKSCLHQLVNKRMTLCAYLAHPSMEYHVVKCSCVGKDIISDTINKGFAKPQSDYIEEIAAEVKKIVEKILQDIKVSIHVESLSKSAYYKPNSSNHEFDSKYKAYACGTDIKPLSAYYPESIQSFNSKLVESATAYASVNNMKSRKMQPKIKDVTQKSEELCNGTVEETKKESDFHPKMIIKRGSELGDLVKGNVSVDLPKEKDSIQHSAYMLDAVIPNLKLINKIRGLVLQSSDDSIINNAVDVLKYEMNTIELTETAIKYVDDSIKDYTEAIEEIKKCQDMSLLPSLKSKRDSCRLALCHKLKDYLGSCDSKIFERKDKIQKLITDLASNSNAWTNVQLHKKPGSIDELVTEYNKVKDERWNLVSKARAKTNQAHKEFTSLLAVLQKEFHLNTLEESEALDSLESNFSKKDKDDFLVTQCLLEFLDHNKEKVDVLCDLYENRYAKYNELSKLPIIDNTLKELTKASEDIHKLTNQITQINTGDGLQHEDASFRRQLHQALLKEDSLKGVLAKVYADHFPELYIENKELDLNFCLQSKLLQKKWKPEYFLNFGTGPRGESSYVSCLLDEPVTIKEYSFQNSDECRAFINTAVLWNQMKSDMLVKVKALFVKDEKTICVVLPSLTNTLFENAPVPSPYEGERVCRFLRQVLIALKDVHIEGLVHRFIHPLTIVIENEKALLDFCFDAHYLDGKLNLKGIYFQPPENKAVHESADMYAFGCLVLWALFPNLSFTTTADGVPNIAAFRSIIEELILPKDYALLCALLDANPERRPSSCTLISKNFLSKYETFCRSHSKNS
ncbi:UNVERIFIED_CONTAM: Stk31 [Trichonephila clavipes]